MARFRAGDWARVRHNVYYPDTPLHRAVAGKEVLLLRVDTVPAHHACKPGTYWVVWGVPRFVKSIHEDALEPRLPIGELERERGAPLPQHVNSRCVRRE